MINYAYPSGLLSADGIVSSQPCLLTGVDIITNGAADATVILYDELSATGTVLFKGLVLAAAGAKHFNFAIPKKAKIGVYLDIDGAGANCIVDKSPE